MAKRILRGFQGEQSPNDVVGFDKDRLNWDWSMRDRNNENDEEDTEKKEESANTPNSNSSDNQNNNQTEQKQENKSTTNKSNRSAFGQAFKNARAAGKKTFWWKGKEYNTKIKSEANTRNKSVTNKKSNTTSNTSSNKNVSNVTNNKQSNTTNNTTNKKTRTTAKASYSDYVKQDSSYKAQQERERLRKLNIAKQFKAALGVTTAQDYKEGYNDQKARIYLANARKRQPNNFTKAELNAIRKAEQNKKKRGY